MVSSLGKNERLKQIWGRSSTQKRMKNDRRNAEMARKVVWEHACLLLESFVLRELAFEYRVSIQRYRFQMPRGAQ